MDSLGSRVMVVGASGSGKTTLGSEVSSVLGFKFVDLDTLFWKPNWIKPVAADFKRDVDEATEGETWVTAGNYRLELAETLWKRADTLIWIDLPLRVVILRILRRAWRRSRSGELLWGTNRENFWRHLKLWDRESSLVAWAIASDRRRRQQHLEMMYDPVWVHLRIVRLCSSGEVAAFIQSLRKEGSEIASSQPHDASACA